MTDEPWEEARRIYEEKLPRWQSLGSTFLGLLNATLADASNIYAVRWRVKAWQSLREKMARRHGGQPSKNPLSTVTDVLGFRIIVFDEAAISKVITALSQIVQVDSRDTHSRPAGTPAAAHLVVRIPAKSPFPQLNQFQDEAFEVQIRTAFEDVWAEIDHKLSYKALPKQPIARAEKIATELEQLIEKPDVHEKKDVHRFLLDHPFLLRSTPDDLIPEVAIGLGTEFRLDFLRREPIGDYVAIELENPRHRMFTKSGDFTAPVNHAIQQVEDWQEWIADNLPMVQRKYPDISSPQGLIIVGRSNSFTRTEHRKLARRNLNLAGRVAVMTYDGLLADVRSHIASMRNAMGM